MQARITELVLLLDPLETYWAYPGRGRLQQIGALCDTGDYESAMRLTDTVRRQLSGHEEPTERPAFQVLVVDDIPTPEADALREEIRRLRRPEDPFIYELVIVPSFEDALVAVLLNSEVQACVIRPGFTVTSPHSLADMARFIENVDLLAVQPLSTDERMLQLGEQIAERRPEVDLYLVAQVSIEQLAGTLTRRFRRIFDRRDLLELHLTILQGVAERYEMPFFTALRGYSRQPTGVFHALPISRGKSVVNSPWIHQMSHVWPEQDLPIRRNIDSACEMADFWRYNVSASAWQTCRTRSQWSGCGPDGPSAAGGLRVGRHAVQLQPRSPRTCPWCRP